MITRALHNITIDSLENVLDLASDIDSMIKEAERFVATAKRFEKAQDYYETLGCFVSAELEAMRATQLRKKAETLFNTAYTKVRELETKFNSAELHGIDEYDDLESTYDQAASVVSQVRKAVDSLEGSL